ncbi:ATP-dependent zinc metalloprotease FtsH [Candidatus Oleimmundimicrobium sp.]|uniref:ATP-dependent zinc metalloprotease FtsH n=1 Tax=Candidatus Oleimmundimicrobium sp. TaxID=3060597 RepID=UPI00271E41C4|nr:ATP-dependent zinc metalloprotease FtsH [Candidatus Oleimmundimicrobium sp.]MDO8885915.1 ATP-dependent zinc metalloprotease FtsH [Candidatus Oleimmundimicrobium sp.]
MKKIFRNAGFYFLIIILILFLAQNFLGNQPGPKEYTLNTFLKKLDSGEVSKVLIKNKDHIVEGELKNGEKFTVTYEENYNITEKLIDKDVSTKVDPQKESMWIIALINLLPFVLIIGIWLLMMNQMQGGGNRVMSFGKSRAKRLNPNQPKVTFKDIAGVDEAVEELKEIEEYLANPSKFQAMGAKVPKGVLLYGPPGTGKTLLARAVAGEANVPFFSISGSDFVEMFVGVGASRVRDLFEQAKINAPSIIFMDEIDAVGRHRGAGLGGGHDEREQTLNQLLVEMDGFDVKDNVILIAATNRPDILDPALLRPGRFDRQIVVDRPDLRGREGILKIHVKGKPLTKDISLDVLARRTPGFTGADLANMVNEAALLTARHNKKKIDMIELEEAIDRVIAGPERKTRLISDKEKEIIAYHEAGHALVAHTLPNTDPVHKISIISRGMALGYTLTLPTEDKYLVSRSELLDELAMLLGGRVAEEMLFGDITTGAQNDLERTTKIARKMVCEYGMSDKIGPLTLGQKQEQVFLGRDFASHTDYSGETAYEIDKEIRRIVDEAYEKAREILTKHRKKLDKIARALVNKETLEKNELKDLLEGKKRKRVSSKIKKSVKKEDKKNKKPETLKKKRIIDIPGKIRPVES